MRYHQIDEILDARHPEEFIAHGAWADNGRTRRFYGRTEGEAVAKAERDKARYCQRQHLLCPRVPAAAYASEYPVTVWSRFDE